MRKISVVQNALDIFFAEATSREKLLPLVLAKSAKRLNVELSDSDIKLLASALLNVQGTKITLDIEPPCSLGKTAEEIQLTVQMLVDDLADSAKEVGDSVAGAISETLPDALAKVADLMGDRISKDAFEHALHLRTSQSSRAETVMRFWGKAIEQLDFLRHIVVEWNSAAIEHRMGAYANSNISFALHKLVARAYEVVGEIIALARAGYADGALARWRSLHELCVIAMFLAKRSDKCGEMYLSHHWVEELRLIESHHVSGATIAPTSDSDRDRYIRELRKKKKELIRKFGSVFIKDYGWASVELGCARTTFRDLEGHVGMETLRRGYQQANSTVHGGSLATLTRVSLGQGLMDSEGVHPAYGCEMATNYAAASLSMMVAELCLDVESADLLAMSIVVHNFSAQVYEQINQAKTKLARCTPRAKFLTRKAEKLERQVKLKRGRRIW